LSAGGLRGAAHLGVLRRIVRHQIPVEVMLGVSAGAIIAAFYAAVGLSVHEMIEQAPVFRGRHILMHGLTLRSLKPYLRRFCGIIPQRLEQLEAASFTTLHRGIKRLGKGATHLIVSDCRYSASAPPSGDDSLIYIRPDLDGIRPLRPPRTALMKAVWRGEAALTADVVDQIQSWMRVLIS
jgi:hypothetical protein